MPKIFKFIVFILFIASSSLITNYASSANTDETDKVETSPSDYNTTSYDKQIYDPFEPINRGVFKFNNIADRIILEPAAKGYRKLPSPIQTGIGNFFSNLKLPLVIINQFLQGQLGNAASSTGRLVINTTVGIGGLIDVADKFGLEQKEEDFGQTLATWGIPDGPYNV